MSTLAEIVAGPALDYVPEKYQDALARRWAKANDYRGVGGGWIARYGPSTATGKVVRLYTVCQGWGSFWLRMRQRILDDLARELTANPDFNTLVTPESPSYRPTLLVLGPKDWLADALACAYDHAMRLKRDPRRAYRGSRDGMTPALVEEHRAKLDTERRRKEAQRRNDIGLARLRISMGLRDGRHPVDALVDDQGVPVDGLPVLHGLTDAGRVR